MIFLFIYGFLFFLSSMALLGCIAASATICWRFWQAAQDVSQSTPVSSLSMIVALKGVDNFTAAHLNALVESVVDGPVEFLFALESAHDPAFVVCQQVQERHSEKDIRLIVSGSAAGRMGKQHNLAVASQQARYEAIGSMDADVLVEPDTLAVGLRYLAFPQTGVAYFLPAYAGPGPTGGLLVALYSNYYYQLYMGAVALSSNAPFITGALWFMRQTTLHMIGGFEQLDLLQGGKHLLKWMTMLRAEGLLTFLTFLVGLLLFGTHQPALASGAAFLLCALLGRFTSAFLLNRRVYALPGLRYLWLLPVYELLAVPILFGKGVFQRTIHWRGRRYRLGRHGMIQAVGEQEGGSS